MTKQNVFLLVLLVLAIALLAVPFVRAETQPKLTDSQHQALENKQLKLKLAYVALQAQQNDFQQRLTEFNAQCDLLVKELKLAEGTRCNPETLEFVPPVTAPAPSTTPGVKK